MDSYYKKYEKTIVMDIDNTISFSSDYNDLDAYSKAKPNKNLIRTMQKMTDNGYKFILYTSRGWISCNESVVEAEKKYRTQIETWLSKNHVPYDRLLFGKPYGIYYVDDKGMTPDEFCKVFGDDEDDILM